MNEEKKIKILYVDDEKSNLVAFKANFRLDFDIEIAESGKEGLELLKSKKLFNIIITDQRMPEMTGVEFLESIMESHPDPIRILLTGYTDLQTVIEAVNIGKIFQYVTKPYKEDELKKIILNSFEEYEKRQKIIRDNQQYEFILRQKLLQ
jgi:response regulator RpfG family c-di-GMP phosphodiesterase